MPKPTVTFMCSECGGESLRWAGQCPHCRAWNTLQEFQVRKAPAGRTGRAQGVSSGRSQAVEPRGSRPVPLSEIESEAAPRRPLAWGEVNRVLGVGLVPGSVTQVRESAARLMRLAKEIGVPIFLVGHVTKDGAIAGPRVLEHIVDTVLYLEGDRRQELRILRAMKNRFGSAEEIGVFAMGEAGLEEVPDPSAALLGNAAVASPGTAVVVAIEGTRPLLIEIQSLVNPVTTTSPPRPTAGGLGLHRLPLLISVPRD